MINLFNVSIKRVILSAQKPVGEVLKEMLGPNATSKINQLLDSGGIAFRDLNEQAANTLASRLSDAGASVSVNLSDNKIELFKVRLLSVGSNKIAVIEQVRSITGLGLQESEAIVESNGVVKENIDRLFADKILQKLTTAGAIAFIQAMSVAGEDNYLVTGRVSLHDGKPASGVLVRAYDKDLRSEQLLGEASTLENGTYSIPYQQEQFSRSEKNNADLAFRVFNEVGVELALKTEAKVGPDVFFNSPKKSEIELQIEKSATVKASEYERLEVFLSPSLDGAALADLSFQDCQFLVNETEIREFPDEFPENRDSIHFIAQSEKLFRETNIPAEAFYGWARRLESWLVPDNDNDQLTLHLENLLEKSDQQLKAALVLAVEGKKKEGRNEAIKGNIIPRWLTEQLASIMEQVQNLRDEKEQEAKKLWTQHQITGILLDTVSDEPLEDYFVRVDTSDQDNPLDLAGSITNTKGEFTATYALPPESASTFPLVFYVETPLGEELNKPEVNVVVDQADPVTIKVTIPIVVEPGEDVMLEALPMSFSSGLDSVLKTNNLSNIAALRKVGDLKKLEGLSASLRGSDELKELQAHVDLSLLATDQEPEQQIEQSQFLIKQGFNSLFDITDTSLKNFSEAMNSDLVTKIDPGKIYATATSLKNLADSLYIDQQIGKTKAPDDDPLPDPKLSCQCEDCVSAISPGAYLTDLLGYVTKKQNIQQADGSAITLEFLVENFHQPLSKLPINCEATKTQVRQVRIACEVLYSALSASELKVSITNDGVIQYRKAAYQALLRQIGTSSFALQRASSAEEIESIANRIGVAPEHVQSLQNQDGAFDHVLAETTLEGLFGLPAFVNMGNATLLDPLRFLRDQQPLPLLYDWRLEHKQKQWKEEDFPKSPLAKNAPVIDPDVIGPDDFRHPEEATNAAFNLWKTRRAWVDEQVVRIHGKLSSSPNKPDAFNDVISEIPGTTIDNLIEKQALLAGDAKHIKKKEFIEWFAERHLSIDEFTELAGFANDVKAGKEYDDGEWDTYRATATNILANNIKKNAYQTWKDEESAAEIILNNTTFWPSLTEPKEGEWSSFIVEGKPLIDPEKIEPKDLPDEKFGLSARTSWNKRRKALDAIQKEYSDILKSKVDDRLKTVMESAFGSALDLQDINTKLNSLDQTEQSKAADEISKLNIDEEGFRSLVSASLILEDTNQVLSDTVQNNLIEKLVSAHKLNVLYEDWIKQDNDLPYWQLLKARLPKWRASQTERQQWKQALEQASKPPLIDPDVISGDVLIEPIVGNFTFNTWRSRTKLLEAELVAITESIEPDSDSNLPGHVTDDVIEPDAISDLFSEKEYLDITHIELIELGKLEEDGISINTRLQQIPLARDAYLLLLDVAKRVEKGSKVLKSTRESVYAILLQTWKIKQFSAWQEEEKSELSLSPEFFKHPKQRPIFTTPQDAQKWRVDTRRQREWYRTLKGRIEQKEILASSLKTTVSDVEEQMLPILRDALIQIVDKTDDAFDIKAEKLTKQFLIGMRLGGCQVTTRVSMALEVLQSLVFSTRSGTIDTAGIELELNSKQFEKEWKWMGSYATWKAAMGVFLYPEQVLYPNLREEQTSEFRRLTSNVPSQFSPEEACKIGGAYYEYLKDVSSLEVKATCRAEVSVVNSHSCFAESSLKLKSILYFFGISKGNNNCYWSTYDSSAQSSWNAIPIGDVNAVDIVGATTSKNKIYLVLRIIDKKEEKLGSLLYDLEKGSWSELVELNIPNSPRGASFVLVQQDLNHNEPRPPSICCLALVKPKDFNSYNISKGLTYEKRNIDVRYSSVLYKNTLSEENSWENEDWSITTLIYDSIYPPYNVSGGKTKITSAVEYKNRLLVSVNIENVLASSGRPIKNPVEGSSINGRFFGLSGVSLETGLNLFDNDIEKINNYFEVKSSIKTVTSYINDAVWEDKEFSDELKDNLNSLKIDKNSIISDEIYRKWRFKSEGIIPPFNIFRIIYGSTNSARLYSFIPSIVGNNFSYSVNAIPDSNRAINDFIERYGSTKSYHPFPIILNNHSIATLAVHHGNSIAINNIELVYNSFSGENGANSLFATITNSSENGQIQRISTKNITPNLKIDLLKISTKLDVESQKNRRARLYASSIINDDSNREYLNDAYFHLPIWVAAELSRSGYYKEALDWYRLVFDYTSNTNRKISWVLQQEERLDNDYEKSSAWPVQLNPHSFAQDRKNAYTHFTVQSIVRCLLDYADSEFTFDTSESVARARSLYNTAAELIQSELPSQTDDKCHARIEEENLNSLAKDKTLQPFYNYLKEKLGEITHTTLLNTTIEQVTAELEKSNVAEQVRLFEALNHIQVAVGERKKETNFIDVFNKSLQDRLDFSRTILSGVKPPTTSFSNIFGRSTGSIDSTNTNEITDFNVLDLDYMPSLSYGFCIPSNPTSRFLSLRAELNLFKIRNCMNIAGMHRELEPYAASIDVQSALPSIGAGGLINLAGVIRIRPTLYRYPVLVDRAKQLTNLAQQTEASFFNAIQSKEQEAERLFVARQGVELAREGVKLQKLRVKESENGVGLAELQLDRAAILEGIYAEWSTEGMLELEKQLLGQYEALKSAQIDEINDGFAAEIASSALTENIGLFFSAGFRAQHANTKIAVVKRQLSINQLSQDVGIALRNREYKLQHQLAEQDLEIGNQQIKLANDRVKITEQEQEISEIQSEQASDTVTFLQEKFTNVELYDWMSGVLESIFRYYLQQASSMSKLAEIQLAFERQEPLIGIIKNDYYELPNNDGNDSASNDSSSIDRRGLTGSARLLRDITKLDQHAFQTDQRKQQLSVNLSLSQLDPFAFQQFKQTGTLNFDTPGKLFDRRFPGQYLRLIKRVRVSVIALVPPVQGISATLTSSGISRVAIKGDVFQTTTIRREPESIAFTNPIGASGVFELNPNPEMLLPFEGNGVDTRWELRLPKASNPMNFNTIADVLFTVEYTALHDRTYQEQVQGELDPYTSFDRAFSFRQEFSDAWYDLHNPEQTDSPMSVNFETALADFPSNVQNINISHILMYIVTDADLPEVFEVALTFNNDGIPKGGLASPVENVLSTRGSANNWTSIKGLPEGEWQLELPNNSVVKQLFESEKIKDILLVLTCDGELPGYK